MPIFTHVVLGTNDLAASTKFYDAALGALGVNNLGPMGENAVLYGAEGPEFLSDETGQWRARVPRERRDTRVQSKHARCRSQISRSGVSPVAAPTRASLGRASFTPTAYAAYLRDPCGNKICAYCFADE